MSAFRAGWSAEAPDSPPHWATSQTGKREIPNAVDSPENREEELHETSLKESENSFRAQRNPSGKVTLERSRVFSNNSSGMLTFAQIEIPFYKGRSPLYLSEIAQFEKKVSRRSEKN